MNDARLEVTSVDQVAYVSLARKEKHNGIDMPMFIALDQCIKKLQKDRRVRAVIISGQGHDFCSGLDVKAVLKVGKNAAKLLFKWLPWQSNMAQRISTGWRHIPAPVIVAIHGRCWGGGLQIALGADFRIATPDSSLSIMEGRWGLIPDMGGTLALRELLNQDVAKEMAMTAKEISGTEAHNLGLVTHLNEEPMVKAKQLAAAICRQNPDAVAGVKKLYNNSWWSSVGLTLARETWYQIRVIMGKNQRIKAYNQTHDESKQKPFFARKKW